VSKKLKKDSSLEESEDDDIETEKEDKKERKKKRSSSPRGCRKALLPERYDGTAPLTIFLTQLESCARYNKWSMEDKAIHLRVSLKGNAAYIIDDETLEDATYEQLVVRLKSKFGTEGQSYLYQARLRQRRRGKDETLQALYHDISRMAGLAFPGKSSIQREIAETEAFIEAINDGSLRMRIRNEEPNRLELALRIALLAEANTAKRVSVEAVEINSKVKNYKARSALSANGAMSASDMEEAMVAGVNSEDMRKCARLLKHCPKL